jgi:hypothetical protein
MSGSPQPIAGGASLQLTGASMERSIGAGKAESPAPRPNLPEINEVPPGLRTGGLDDPLYGSRRPLFRRSSGLVRVTLFEGAHEVAERAAIGWPGRQRRSEAGICAESPVAAGGCDGERQRGVVQP